MKFTLFLEASNSEETNKHLDDFKKFAVNYKVFMSVSEIGEYWKIKGMYKVFLDIDESSESNVKPMLNNIASKWLELPNEFLASNTMDGCEIYIPNLHMITLVIDDN
ncbi:hypothetical protein JFV29_09165 [Peribacillus sp. TH16]|uniref:hypothetical protein n=1 Tax=Peribacillus sp. TH16 TaxID=2798482 RepID=UPI001914CD75|nr:hypothetical protein [Peribacillus sp. TH16]MBK5482091.1 hypothetical protein [Peribacillus sp. TH16]